MKKLFCLFTLATFGCWAADSVVFLPPAPGQVTITTTSGKIAGTIGGNTNPATAVVFNLTLNGSPVVFTVPMVANQALTLSQGWTSGGITDNLTGIYTSNATGIIHFSITLNGGVPVTGNF